MEFVVKIRDGAQFYKEGFKNKLIYLPKNIAKNFQKDENVKVTIERI